MKTKDEKWLFDRDRLWRCIRIWLKRVENKKMPLWVEDIAAERIENFVQSSIKSAIAERDREISEILNSGAGFEIFYVGRKSGHRYLGFLDGFNACQEMYKMNLRVLEGTR